MEGTSHNPACDPDKKSEPQAGSRARLLQGLGVGDLPVGYRAGRGGAACLFLVAAGCCHLGLAGPSGEGRPFRGRQTALTGQLATTHSALPPFSIFDALGEEPAKVHHHWSITLSLSKGCRPVDTHRCFFRFLNEAETTTREWDATLW